MFITITIEKLVFGGQGLGRLPTGQVAFVWNALPGETVEARVIKNRRDYLEAMAVKILTPSPFRVKSDEECFLSTSPWDIIEYKKEAEFKRLMAEETFQKIGKIPIISPLPFIDEPGCIHGYRNKIEFSFTQNKSKGIELAFFVRGSKYPFSVTKTLLALPCVNKTAQYILDWINENQIPIRSLKTMIVRANLKGETLVGLFIKDRLDLKLPQPTSELKGFKLYYSDRHSPASVPTELLSSFGEDYLEENILNTKLRFGLLSFFQINPPMFEKALKDISENIKKDEKIVDYYSGVGAIGIPLSSKSKEVTLIENNPEAVEFAQINIQNNGLKKCSAMLSAAEQADKLIEKDATIIFDPPRAGLAESLIQTVLNIKPQKIIYLSCNVSTQARDLKLLLSAYKITDLRLYNFFPRTPHVESLAILEKK